MNQHQTLIGQLMDRLEEIAQTIKYPQFFVNERCLVDHMTYLNICKYMFPELKPHLTEIENLSASPAQKLDYLLELLNEALDVDFSKVNGTEITRYNLSHIQKVILVLHEYTKIINQNVKRRIKIRSESGSAQNGINDPQVPKSAREPDSKSREEQKKKVKEIEREGDFNPNLRKQFHHPKPYQQIQYSSEDEEKAESGERKAYYLDQQNNEEDGQTHKKINRKERNQRAETANLHSNVVNKIIKQKERMINVAERDNRKNKMEFVSEAKDAYRTFLKRYTKENKAKNNRETILTLKSAAAVKPLKQEIPREDFDRIDKFCQSFAYRFRDKKTAYLRKISQIVRKQQIDRFCYHNKIQRESKKYMEERLQKELQAARHQHRVKSEMLQESSKHLQSEIQVMKKEELKMASEQRKQLRTVKKKQIKQIQNMLNEENQRFLMGLEQGGRLEQIIMKMYKKF